MNTPGQKDKFTPELRILVASLLSFGVIILWAKFFGPKPSVQPMPTNRPAETAPAVPGPATRATANPLPVPAAPLAKATAAAVKNDSEERTIVVENSLYRVEISNRGAVVKSWQLKNYKDDAKPQRVLDVVHPEVSEQTGGWPFSVVLDDEQLQNAANGGLYQLSSPATALEAPAEVTLNWSDGHLEVAKHFQFDHSYVVGVETSVKFNGRPMTTGLAWLGGPIQVVGAAAAAVAALFLGRSFGLVAANRGVQLGGAYRLVRHPMYGAHALGYLGYVLTYPSAANVMVVGATLLLLNARAVAEERILARDPAYREYLQRLPWRFLPYVY